MIRGIELDRDNFLEIGLKITELLKQDKEFTSEKYSGLDIPTVNDKWLLIEPKKEWLELIKPLGLIFKDYDNSIIKSFKE